MPEIDDEEGLTEQQAEAVEALNTDFSIGNEIKDRLVPDAVMWYTGEALDSEDEDDEEETDDEDDDEQADLMRALARGDLAEDDGDDPEYQPGPGEGDQAPECKQS